MLKRLGLLLLVCVLSGGADSARADEFARCETRSIQTAFDRVPAAVATQLTRAQPLTIVAFGSSSTFGTGASTPAATYPARLELELAQQFPMTPVTMINRGVVGDTAAMMLARLQSDVIAERPDIVIWQVGANDIEKAVPRDVLRAQIRLGLEQLRAAGAEVLLMETQWYPRLGEKSDWPDYRADLRQIAAEWGIPLIQRYEMMKSWIDQGLFKESDLLAADRFHMRDASYGCLARSLAIELKAFSKALTVGALQITQ